MLTLRRLALKDEAKFRAALAAFPDTPSFSFVSPQLKANEVAFASLLETLSDLERGVNLPEGAVASSLLFGFTPDGEIAGRVSIRHSLTPALTKIGGHVGYGVLPSMRNRGFASEMLKLTLPYCKNDLKLDRILLTCDDDNIPSIRTIENGGGVLENKFFEEGMRAAKRRYWINLT